MTTSHLTKLANRANQVIGYPLADTALFFCLVSASLATLCKGLSVRYWLFVLLVLLPLDQHGIQPAAIRPQHGEHELADVDMIAALG